MADALAEKVVQVSINSQHLEYCPTMDLIAAVTVDDQVQVYRLNGQKVFGTSNKQGSSKVCRIKWKPNGQCLATAYNNNSLSLTSAHTGKIIHDIDCSAYSKSEICCLGWGVNFTDTKRMTEQIKDFEAEITLDDIISRNPQIKAIDAIPDLPMDLAFLDIETSLPKLSPLASAGIQDDIFNSRTSLDTMFQPLMIGPIDSADVLMVGFEDGTIHLSIYDCFEIGSFNLHQAARGFHRCKPLLHCFHPLSTTQLLIVEDKVEGHEELHIVPLDLRLISNARRYLSLLASKSTQLHNVLRYIHQVQGQIYSDFKASQDLPRKFIGNLEETLREQSDCSWIQAAYHLVVTGHCSAEFKEWLVDQLGERGHKRWEKAINTGYESVRRLVHENLLPALERFTVLVSRLRGLAKFQVSNVTLGLSTQDLDNVLDTVSCLQLAAHKILSAVISELRQFQAFSEWFRQEIDTQASDANSSETTEKDINIDYANTLAYIQGPMMQSQLIDLLDLRDKEDSRSQMTLAAKGRPLFDLYKKEYKTISSAQYSAKHLPGLDALVKHLNSQCEIIFRRIAETQRRNVRFGTPIFIGAGSPSCIDTRTLVEDPVKSGHSATYVVLGPRVKQPGIHIYRIILEIENGMSSKGRVERAIIRTGGWIIRDIKFVDDSELVIAATGRDSSRVFRFPYNTANNGLGLKYELMNGSRETEVTGSNGDPVLADMDLADTETCDSNTWLKFPEGISWAPERLVVNGRKGRRVIGVLAQDKLRYRIFDLDNSSSDAPDSQDAGVDRSDEMMTE